MPFVCAVPIGLPPRGAARADPVGGPYYISAHDRPAELTTFSRNPNYVGPRPQPLRHRSSTTSEPDREAVLPAGRVGRSLTIGPVPSPMSKRSDSCTAPKARPRNVASAVVSVEAAKLRRLPPPEHRATAVRRPHRPEHAAWPSTTRSTELRTLPSRGPYAATPFTISMLPRACRGTKTSTSIPTIRRRARTRPRRLAPWRPAAADHGLLPVERHDQPGAVPDSSRATSSRSGST